MVSPVDKNGGEVDAPGADRRRRRPAGRRRAAARSPTAPTASFAGGGQGAPPASQYLATRGSGGWATENITAPIFSGTYDATDQGVPYQLFSADLSRALLLNGDHCRGEAKRLRGRQPAACRAPMPRRATRTTTCATTPPALRGPARVPPTPASSTLDPADFDLRLAGASPDLAPRRALHLRGAHRRRDRSRRWAKAATRPSRTSTSGSGAGLSLVNLLPAQPPAPRAPPSPPSRGAVSERRLARLLSTPTAGTSTCAKVEHQPSRRSAGAGGAFQTASADGAVAFYTKAGHLYRYDAGGHARTDLTPSAAESTGVLGASARGDTVYYQDGTGSEALAQRRDHDGRRRAPKPPASDYPPTTGTARVSADGTKLLFLSKAHRCTGYDNTDLNTGEPRLRGLPLRRRRRRR